MIPADALGKLVSRDRSRAVNVEAFERLIVYVEDFDANLAVRGFGIDEELIAVKFERFCGQRAFCIGLHGGESVDTQCCQPDGTVVGDFIMQGASAAVVEPKFVANTKRRSCRNGIVAKIPISFVSAGGDEGVRV